MNESVIPSSSKKELRFVEIKNMKDYKLEIDENQCYKILECNKVTLKGSTNSNLLLRRIQLKKSRKNIKAKKEPIKANNEILIIKDLN